MGFWSWLLGRSGVRARPTRAPGSPYRRPAPVVRAPEPPPPPPTAPPPRQAGRSRAPLGVVAVTVATSVVIAAGRSPRAPSRARQPWEEKRFETPRFIPPPIQTLDWSSFVRPDVQIQALETQARAPSVSRQAPSASHAGPSDRGRSVSSAEKAHGALAASAVRPPMSPMPAVHPPMR